MNVKYILVFTTYVVLSNGHTATTEINDVEVEDRRRFRQAVIEHWSPSDFMEGGSYEDDNGNVFLRLLVKHGENNSIFYVLDVKRIGVKLVTPAKDQDENEKLIDFFANLLEVPKNAVQVVTGVKSKEKTLKLHHGYLAMKDALGILADECLNVQFA